MDRGHRSRQTSDPETDPRLPDLVLPHFLLVFPRKGNFLETSMESSSFRLTNNYYKQICCVGSF